MEAGPRLSQIQICEKGPTSLLRFMETSPAISYTQVKVHVSYHSAEHSPALIPGPSGGR